MHIEFDSNPIMYWLAGYSFALALSIIIYLSISKTHPYYEKLFLLLSAILLVLMRLPVLLFNRELNADESQMLTQAMTLFKDPVYWRSVDGTTGGPLGSYFLILPSLFTGIFDYTTAHISSLLLVFVTLAAFYFAVRNWFGNITAMAASYPLVLFFAFTQQEDFVHYSSEHVPMAMMALIVFLFSIYSKKSSDTQLLPLTAGFLIALLPFGKLQTLPMVVVLVLWGLYIFYERKKLISEGLWFLTGGIGTLAIIVVLLILGNVFNDFIQFYIIGNFQYGGEISWWDNLMQLPESLKKAPPILSFLIPQVILLLLALAFLKHNKQATGKLLFFPIALVFFTLLAISRTGSGYLHYWLFSLIPLSLLFANYIKHYQDKSIVIFSFCITCLCSICMPRVLGILNKEAINKYPSGGTFNTNIPFTSIARHVLKYGKKGEYLVVWGWNCQFYVEAQMPQGVAENHSIRSIFLHPMQETYLDRYLLDIMRNKPAVIVDAVGKNSLWVQDPSQRLDRYPSLIHYVSDHYKLAETIDEARIYVRNDKLVF